jgi:hypothetical protein
LSNLVDSCHDGDNYALEMSLNRYAPNVRIDVA